MIPGASIYLVPKDGSGVLAVFAKGDKAEITGLHGGWTQLRLEKTLVGYIRTGPPEPVAAAMTPAIPAASAPSSAPPVRGHAGLHQEPALCAASL